MLHFSILFMAALASTPAPDHLIQIVDNNNQPLPHYSVTLMIDNQPIPAETSSDGQLLVETDEVIINGDSFTLDEEQELIVISDVVDEPLQSTEQPYETLIQVVDQLNEPLPTHSLLLDGEEVMTDEEGQLLLELSPGDHELSYDEKHMTLQAGEKDYFTIETKSEQSANSSVGSSSEEMPIHKRVPKRRPAAGLVIQKPSQKPIQRPIQKSIKTLKPAVLHPQPKPQPKIQQKPSEQRSKKIATKKIHEQHIETSQKPVKVHIEKEKIAKVTYPTKQTHSTKLTHPTKQIHSTHPTADIVPHKTTQKVIKKTPVRKISVKPQLPVTKPQVDPRPQVKTEEIATLKYSRPKKKKSLQLPQAGEHDITKLISSILAVSGISLLIFSRRSFRT
ncbi:hypothetical protein ERX27_03795 [Macrococcus brunensis]|uniref:LPXTG cell wall anchor domain-containing protein n=1 Tax=Macrococcus brunensis TaxID=198483 RepID=A0A4R6BEL9_9STAP|nr:hypothetical protein [Macrococcus brunensis]TDL98270.1 hypothetical protein ERX27_03795 [Macrococcus brunensis]